MGFRSVSVAAVLTLAVAAPAISFADSVSINFDSMPTGAVPGGPDPRTPGNGQFWAPDNGAVSGVVTSGVGVGGTAGLVIGNRGNGNDGVIQGVLTPQLVQSAGEASTAAPQTTFTSSYNVKLIDPGAGKPFELKSETWGVDRDTWLGFTNDFTGPVTSLGADAIGYDSSGNEEDVHLASGLQYGVWYTVLTSIQFNNSPAGDLVTQTLQDSLGNTLGSVTTDSWKGGNFDGGPFSVNAMSFQARYSTPGDVAVIDNVTYATPEPASLGVLAAGGVALLARRRRLAR